jgi:putative nucleotidyltransferase with HDIG domain
MQSAVEASEVELGGEDVVKTVAYTSLDKVLTGLAGDDASRSKTEAKLCALFRAASQLGCHQSEDALISAILADALQVLGAQRAALVLLNDGGELELRAVNTAPGCRPGGFPFSRHMARRCLLEGTSLLCSRSALDRELQGAASVCAGEMNSIVCALLRTPRHRLGVLHLDRNPLQQAFTYEDLQLADALAASVSAGLESARLLRQQQEWFLGTLTTLVQAVELRDPYTAGHAQRVTHYSLMLAQQLNLSPVDLHWLRVGTPLHDIGKIGIADAILNKPGPLTAAEFEVMKSHTVKGEEMLRHLINLQTIFPIVRSHHERWDGKGYPDGLIGEDTPFLARVVAVADSFDAMTTDRPYRRGLSFARAAEEIRSGSGKQYDPICAGAFFDIRTLLEEEARDRAVRSPAPTPPPSLRETRRFRLPAHIPPVSVP